MVLIRESAWGIRDGVYTAVAVGEGELEDVVFFVVEGGFEGVGGGGAGGGGQRRH